MASSRQFRGPDILFKFSAFFIASGECAVPSELYKRGIGREYAALFMKPLWNRDWLKSFAAPWIQTTKNNGLCDVEVSRCGVFHSAIRVLSSMACIGA